MFENSCFISWVQSICSLTIACTFLSCCLFSSYSLNEPKCTDNCTPFWCAEVLLHAAGARLLSFCWASWSGPLYQSDVTWSSCDSSSRHLNLCRVFRKSLGVQRTYPSWGHVTLFLLLAVREPVWASVHIPAWTVGGRDQTSGIVSSVCPHFKR